MKPEYSSHPTIALGCRLNERDQQPRVLHMPERALKLNGPSLEIIVRCDGKHTVQEIVLELQKLYSKAEPGKVEKEILDYLELLHDRRALDFASVQADAGKVQE
jgi:pyrroloquinoline quinone biosynthesis protein D